MGVPQRWGWTYPILPTLTAFPPLGAPICLAQGPKVCMDGWLQLSFDDQASSVPSPHPMAGKEKSLFSKWAETSS